MHLHRLLLELQKILPQELNKFYNHNNEHKNTNLVLSDDIDKKFEK